ncbi:MAG: sporulation protein YqfD [Clostridia bacterium]|nr:sporulation protein YqfD [Clostridia bacterium]
MKYAVLLLRYLRGYVRVHAVGGFPERFINLCHAAGIVLWDVCLKDKVLTFCVSRKHFLKLRHIAAKSGVRIKIKNKNGIIYKYRKHHKRTGFLTGVLLFLIIQAFLSMFVWCIDVKGNNDINKNDILLRAEYYGLKAGTFKKSFDEIGASRKIATDYNGKVTWLSINIKGSLAVIELREDDKILNGTEDKPPCNIVADFDGVILSSETYCGDCTVKKGTGVKKGDLLISGAIINEDMSTTFYPAKGKFTALHEKEINISESTGSGANQLIIVGKKYEIGFFGIKIPFNTHGKAENASSFSERKSLVINGYTLPFYIEKTVICQTERTENVNSTVKALEKMQHSIYKQNANSTVINKNETVSASENSIRYSGKYTLIDFLGEEKLILSESSK